MTKDARLDALRLAVSSSTDRDTCAAIVLRARAFYGFLEGETATTEEDTHEPVPDDPQNDHRQVLLINGKSPISATSSSQIAAADVVAVRQLDGTYDIAKDRYGDARKWLRYTVSRRER